jgi:radical SAM-linked protein
LKAQRLRFLYRIAGPAATLGHRELIAIWERALREAGLPLAYSQGKRPSPQISIGALLPLGVTSDGELVDVFLSERADPRQALAALAPHLPEGIEVLAVQEVGLTAPSLQSLVRWAEYEALVPAAGLSREEVAARVQRLLEADAFPAEYRRETKVRHYDLRPLVLALRVAEGEREGCFLIRMRLRAEPEMTGRADQVLLALGLPPAKSIRRTRLYVEEVQPAIMAYRRLGEPEED